MANDSENKSHWDMVYGTKTPSEVSWTQEVPETSLAFIFETGISKNAPIIDVGGGDSKLVDHLLAKGYENITVLDISEKALERAKKRLGDIAKKVTWIACDITSFEPTMQYEIWHDRATFHFLTTTAQIEKYVAIAGRAAINHLIIGTFSHNGPQKCSGLQICQYNADELEQRFSKEFTLVKCITEDHLTPFGTQQHFQFCSFKSKQ